MLYAPGRFIITEDVANTDALSITKNDGFMAGEAAHSRHRETRCHAPQH